MKTVSKSRRSIGSFIVREYCNKTWAYLVYTNPNVQDASGMEIDIKGGKKMKIHITLIS